jgi:hypothetical protein
VADVQVVEELLEARLDLVGFDALQLQHRLDVLRDGELAEDRRFLRQVGEPEARAPVDRQVREVLAVERHRAAVDGHEAQDHVEAGGLARAVGTEQPHHLAALHRERNVGDDGALAIALHEPLGAQHGKARLRPHEREVLRRRRTRDHSALPWSVFNFAAGAAPGFASSPAPFLGGRITAFTR